MFAGPQGLAVEEGPVRAKPVSVPSPPDEKVTSEGGPDMGRMGGDFARLAPPERRCICGTDLTGTHGRRRFCSERCRRMQYAGTCEQCGASTNGHNGPGTASTICVECFTQAQHEDRRWTRESIIEWIQAFHATRGIVPPSTVQVARGKYPDAPGTEATGREFGADGWRKAVRAAGFEPYRDHPGTGHKLGAEHPAMQETVRLYAEGFSLSQIASRHGVTLNAIRSRLVRQGVALRDPVEARQMRREAA